MARTILGVLCGRKRATVIALVLTVAPALALAGFVTPPAAAAGSTYYNITGLDALWANSIARDINESGQITGQGQNPSGQQRAFLWEDGDLKDLGVPTGGNLSRARGINGSGQVVGEWRVLINGQQRFKAFLYEDGQMKDLNSLISAGSGWDLIGAQAINEIGQIVGSGTINGQTHAFLYQNGTVTDLGETLGGPYSAAWSVNDLGDVVGGAGSSESQSEAFVYRNGSASRIGNPGSFSASEAAGINNSGQVIGWSFNPGQSTPQGQAFIYDSSEVGEAKIEPLEPLSGDLYSRARDIDEAARVVGWSRNDTGGSQAEQFSAVLWEDGKVEDLNDLIPANSGWKLTDAYAINESGQIVGTGFRDGRLQAFLLTPDTTPPDTTIDSEPSGIETTGDASFTFSSTEPNSTFECSLDGAAFSACSSPQPYNELADGSHTFEVRATDAAGNTDPTPASYTWTVDTAAPTGTIDINGGDAYTNSTTVNLTLSATDPSPGTSVVEMRFSNDDTTWSDWEAFDTSKQWTVSGGDGETIVYVQFRDAAGNESATAQDTISLETVDPTTTHTLSPAPNASGWNNSDVSVTLNATDNGGSGVKQISYFVNGGEPITVQQNSVQIPVTDEGETTISYHAADNAGNAEAQQAFTVKIDKSAPDATITSGPSGPTNDTTPTVSFGGSDNLTASSSLLFSYKVVADGVAPESVAWSEYSSSTSTTLGDTMGLSEDSYTFHVKVKDQAGNEDASPAQRSFTVDTTAPTVESVRPPNKATGVTLRTNVRATFLERMDRTTIGKSTLKLYKVNPDGTTTQVTNVTVKLSAEGSEAKLNPFGTSSKALERNTRYKAIVTTGAQDLAGNPLAAKEVWSFTTR